MRVWEIEDNKAVPSDLVREQDFIMCLRRLQRHNVPCLILNFILNAISPLAKDHDAMVATQKKLQEAAQAMRGGYFEMTRGDVFLVWEGRSDAENLTTQIINTVFPDMAANKALFLLTYLLPRDYARIRERANHYVEAVRAAATVGALEATARVEDARGPLTAKTVDQIGHLLGEVNLRRYGRTQRIYNHLPDGSWQPFGEEYFVSFEDLRREHFPRLEVVTSEHFFLALCGMLDQKLLTMLTSSYELVSGRMMNINLSVATIMGSTFAQFVHRVPRDERHLIGFEINRGDIFQDFTLTLNALEELKREGFRIALDGVTPDMVTYLNLASFPVDAVKINVSKDRVSQLSDPSFRKGIAQVPPEKIVFFRCDNERAFTVGSELGVTTFQGWLIDDLAGKK